MVSPVDELNVLRLTQVGPTSGGLPTGADYVDSLVTTGYDLVAQTNWRRRIVFDRFSTTRLTNQSHNGAVVQLNIVDDLDDSPTTAALLETYDVLPTNLVSWKTPIILAEWGRTVSTTALIRGTSMVPIDPVAAERVGRNMAATLERLALNTLLAAGGVTKTGTVGSTPSGMTVAGIPSDTLRTAYQYFLDNNVSPMGDGMYIGVITPAAATALRKESDAAGWRYWAINQDPNGANAVANIGQAMSAPGYIGDYEGFHLFTSTIPGLAAVGGVFFGEDALAKAGSIAPGMGMAPQVVIAPVVDKLKRFATVGWFWLGNYARFRSEAVVTGNLAG